MKNGGMGGGGESQKGSGAGGAAGGGAAGGGSSPVTARPESVKCVRNVKLDQMQERENDTKNAMMLADDQLKQAREAREGKAGPATPFIIHHSMQRNRFLLYVH